MNLAGAVRTLHRQQWVPHPLETVFDFFEHPENLTLITPPWLGLRLRTPGSLTMRAGLVIDYHVRVLGWTTRWQSLIGEYEPPYNFRDVQVIGPYRRWDHRAVRRRGGREPDEPRLQWYFRDTRHELHWEPGSRRRSGAAGPRPHTRSRGGSMSDRCGSTRCCTRPRTRR